VAAAIRERQAELARLESELGAFAEPLRERLAVIPGWAEAQLRDLERLLGDAPERVKLEFQRIGLRVVMEPVRDNPEAPFHRAIAEAALPWLAGTTELPRQTVDRSLPQAAGSRTQGTLRFSVDLPPNQLGRAGGGVLERSHQTASDGRRRPAKRPRNQIRRGPRAGDFGALVGADD